MDSANDFLCAHSLGDPRPSPVHQTHDVTPLSTCLAHDGHLGTCQGRRHDDKHSRINPAFAVCCKFHIESITTGRKYIHMATSGKFSTSFAVNSKPTRVHKGFDWVPVDLAVDVEHHDLAKALWGLFHGKRHVLFNVMLPETNTAGNYWRDKAS